jgi:hypothetical protein
MRKKIGFRWAPFGPMSAHGATRNSGDVRFHADVKGMADIKRELGGFPGFRLRNLCRALTVTGST